jgi:lipopolysaccharide export system protein LptA
MLNHLFNKQSVACFSWLAIFCMNSTMANTAKTKVNKTIYITANEAMLDIPANQSVWKGSVVVVQDNITLKANKLTAKKIADNMQYQAAGTPVYFIQRAVTASKTPHLEAYGLNMLYKPAENLMHITDKAKIIQGSDTIEGDVIIMNLETKQYSVKSHNGGRVKLSLTPKD